MYSFMQLGELEQCHVEWKTWSPVTVLHNITGFDRSWVSLGLSRESKALATVLYKRLLIVQQCKHLYFVPLSSEPVPALSTSALCEICKEVAFRYKCPRCLKKTCCLACVKLHKTRDDCSGLRDKTAYVAMKQFSEIHLLNGTLAVLSVSSRFLRLLYGISCSLF